MATGSGTSTRDYFNHRSARYTEGNWQKNCAAVEEMRMIESLPSGLDIAVDLGSGPGQIVPALAGRARTVLAVDASPGMLKLRQHDSPALVADGLALPLKSKVADVAYLRMSMHYFPLDVLREELFRILKPDGWLFITSIFPYGKDDERWFNERHRLKGKGNAYTPSVESMCLTLSPRFNATAVATWHAENSIAASMRSHPLGSSADLVKHALTAPGPIRSLYRIRHDEASEDTFLTVKWAVVALRLSSGPGK